MAGSCVEYDVHDRLLVESDRVAPRSLYAACKLSAYQVANTMAKDLGAELTWTRIFHIHGPEEDPRRLTCEWLVADYLEINGGSVSVVRFELVAMGPVTRLTVSHRGLDPAGSLLKAVTPGWPMILSSLKSLVETGEPLEFRLSA